MKQSLQQSAAFTIPHMKLSHTNTNESNSEGVEEEKKKKRTWPLSYALCGMLIWALKLGGFFSQMVPE